MSAYVDVNAANLSPLITAALKQLSLASCAEEEAFKQGVEIVKSNKFSYIGILREEPIFVKCYRPKGAINRFLTRCLLARPFKSYSLAKKIGNNFTVPEPLALVSNDHSSNVYYFSRYICGFSLIELLPENQHEMAYRIAVLADVGKTLASFHQLGWTHGDFKWSNIVVEGDRHQKAGKIYFIDLDSVKRLSVARKRARGRDLARFIVNAEDHQVDETLVRIFLEAYARHMDEPFESSLAVASGALKKLRRRHDAKYGLRKNAMFVRDE